MEAKQTTGVTNWEVAPQFRQTLSTIIDTLIKPECLKWDLFIALLLLVMKENNFILLKPSQEGPLGIEDYILRKSRTVSIREAIFVLKGFQDMPMKLIACPLNDAVLVIATIPELHEETYSHCFKVSQFVITSTLGIPSDYIHLKELITTLKERIVNPVKGSILNYHKYPSPNLFGLPNDIVHKILLLLSVRDILSVGKSCKKLYRITKEDPLWFRLCNRDFPDQNKSDDSWYEMYVKLYVLEQEERSKARYYGSAGFRECFYLSQYMRRVSDSRWEVIL